jgi:hypothetical protein
MRIIREGVGAIVQATFVEIGRIPYGWRKLAAGVALCVLALATCVLVARRLTSASWPLAHADAAFVVMGGAAYLASFAFRAQGWRQVFPRRQRPDYARCLAACGAAAASGAVLPFRLDYVVKITMLRRLRGVTLELDTIVLSIVTLGLVDAAVTLPLAIAAISTSGAVFVAPLTVVILFCLCCLGILLVGRRLPRLPLVGRSRRATTVCERVAETSAVTRSTLVAGAFLFACWTLRALGSAFLLTALGAGFSPTLALVVLCMAGAAAILPITSGGAIAGMGATAGVLFALGASKDVAINFSLASGLLLIIAALTAAVAGLAGSVGRVLIERVAVGARF